MDRKSRWQILLTRRGSRLLLLVGAVLLLYQLSGYEALVGLRDVWTQVAAMRSKIDSLREENTRIESEIKELAPDGNEVERIARQDLGWAEPGEIVIKVPEKK
jgi:cell division protein FtsB